MRRNPTAASTRLPVAQYGHGCRSRDLPEVTFHTAKGNECGTDEPAIQSRELHPQGFI
jgi:hypothetical protein